MKKRWIRTVILAFLLCLCLCACNNAESNDSSAADPTSPSDPDDFSDVTVSIASITDGKDDDKWLYDQIEQKFGCKIEVFEIDPAVYDDTMAALLAEGNLPTIFESFLPIGQIVTSGEQGKFVDVMASENLAQMPNFAKLFVDDKDANWEYMLTAAEDGSHYILPSYGCDRPVNHFWVYNETAFKKAGVEWRGDPEGFLQMLRDLKAYYPKSYPMTGGAWDNVCDRTIFTWGVNSSYAAYDYETNQWFYGATSDAYYDMLSMFRTAYNEKLLDPDALFPSSSSIQDPMMNHDSFLFYSWLGWMTMHNAAFSELGLDDREIPAPIPVGPNGKTLEVKKFDNSTGTVINSRDPKAAACAMAIIDWMYDTSKDGGAWRNTVGPEEALFTDEAGRLNWVNDTISASINNDLNIVAKKYGMFQTSLTVRCCAESPCFTFEKEEQMAQEIGQKIGYFRAPPTLSFSDSGIAEAYTASQKEIKDMQTKFITENWDRAKFDAWAADFNTRYGIVTDYLNK